MLSQKRVLAQDIATIIHDLCHLIFNLKKPEEREILFGISDHQIYDILSDLMAALPDELLKRTSKKKLEELKTICAREFIFFQVQERNGDAEYAKNLENFLHILVRDLAQRF